MKIKRLLLIYLFVSFKNVTKTKQVLTVLHAENITTDKHREFPSIYIDEGF